MTLNAALVLRGSLGGCAASAGLPLWHTCMWSVLVLRELRLSRTAQLYAPNLTHFELIKRFKRLSYPIIDDDRSKQYPVVRFQGCRRFLYELTFIHYTMRPVLMLITYGKSYLMHPHPQHLSLPLNAMELHFA